jgi:hypothetical protein
LIINATDSAARVAKRDVHNFQISDSVDGSVPFHFFFFFALIQFIICIKGSNEVAENVE